MVLHDYYNRLIMTNKEQNDLISVIVPIYNTGQPLTECIESILKQTYAPIEILMVDDGSTDEVTLSICNEYEENYQNITVIHQTNGGPSKARNSGIELAHGKYIAFVDSDDCIDADSYKILHATALEYGVPLVLGAMDIIGYKQKFANCGLQNGKYSIETILSKFLQGYWHSSCTNLYQRDLIKDIKFPLGEINEDYIFNFNVLINCNNVAIMNMPLYHYVRRENSRTSSPASIKHLDWLMHTEYVEKRVLSLFGDRLFDEAKFQKLYSNIILANKCILSLLEGIKDEPNKVYSVTVSNLNKMRSEILSNKLLSNRLRLFGLLLSIVPNLYKMSTLSILKIKRWIH